MKSLVNRKKIAIPGIDSFRQKLSAERLSEESAILLQMPKDQLQPSITNRAWRRWDSWCGRRNIR